MKQFNSDAVRFDLNIFFLEGYFQCVYFPTENNDFTFGIRSIHFTNSVGGRHIEFNHIKIRQICTVLKRLESIELVCRII